MAEPTSALSFEDLILRVAREAGIAYYGSSGRERAMIPVDPHDLDLCKRVVNDGIRMFIANGPTKGWRWMRPIASILLDPEGDGPNNISSDPARYLLPENFGGEVNGAITYAEDTNHATSIEWTDEAYIRHRRSITVNTGYPLWAAVRPYHPDNPSLGSSRRWELIVDPKPVATDTLLFPYTIYFDELKLEAGEASGGSDTTLVDSDLANLYPDDYFNGWKIKITSGTGKFSNATVTDYTGSTGTFTVADWLFIDGSAGGVNPADSSIYVIEPANNLHPAGLKFDEAILSACMARAEMEVEDIMTGYVEKYHRSTLPAAFVLDARSAPRKLGSTYGKHRYRYERIWKDVTYDD